MKRALGIWVLIISLMAAGVQASLAIETNFNWRVAGNWPGEVSYPKVAGVSGRVGLLKATQVKDQQYEGKILYLSRVNSLWGHKFRYSTRVKGEGTFRVGVIKYVEEPGEKQRAYTDWSETTYTLGNDWQEVVYEFDLLETSLVRIGIVVEVKGGSNAEAYLTGDKLEVIETPGVTLTASSLPAHPMVEEGKSLPEIEFLLQKDGKPLAGQTLSILVDDKVFDYTTNASGEVAYQPPAGVKYIAATYPKSGVVVDARVDTLTPQLYQAYDSIARKIELSEPIHILIIGDSLSDFNRGSNYVDKLNFWLNRYNPGKADFRNAGVGGDYITRSYDRLSGKAAPRKEMYDGIFDRKADYIFIFLGHNDTKTSSDNDHKTPLVSPEEQEEVYRKMIALLKQKSDAKIVLVSPTSSNFEVCKANAEKQAKQGKKHSRFGEPDKLEAFDAVLRNLANELQLDYIDVYTPTRDAPYKASLFSPTDGVHLTEEGHRYMAMQFLKYFEKRRGIAVDLKRSAPGGKERLPLMNPLE